MAKMLPELKSADCVKRYEHNPILSKKDIPYKADLIFNAGVVKHNEMYYMLFRDDFIKSESNCLDLGTCVGVAKSSDGVHWQVRNKCIELNIDDKIGEIKRFYDPRLIVIDDEFLVCFAVDTLHGVRGGIGKVVGDFEAIDVLTLTTPDNRNLVLFPEKIDGKYVRLERPFPVYSRGCDRFDIWISSSPDLKYWGENELLLGVEDVPYANDKIGPGAPPIKTDYGWLVIFHSVDVDHSRGKNGWEDIWQKRYCAGIMLLDLENPKKVIGLCKTPLLAPELPYETDEGFRTNAIFPGSVIAEGDNVKIYYGASDTVECLAEAKLSDLLKLCGVNM